MYNKQQCYKLLFDMRNQGINVMQQLTELSNSVNVPDNVIKFINEHRSLDITRFYEELRKENNKKGSKLYKEIVDEAKDPIKRIKAISSYITKGIIAAEKFEIVDKPSFYKAIRLDECVKALNEYVANGSVNVFSFFTIYCNHHLFYKKLY